MNINAETARETLCKNITIYGFCKYEEKGCLFSHRRLEKEQDAASKAILNARRFNVHSPSFQPSVLLPSNGTNSHTGPASVSSPTALTSKFAALSPRLKNIPIFVPSSTSSFNESSSKPAPNDSSPSQSPASPANTGVASSALTSLAKRFNVLTPSFTPLSVYDTPDSAPSAIPSSAGTPGTPYMNVLQTPQADVFYSQNTPSYPLQYHLYAPAPPPRLAQRLDSQETDAHLLFISNDLRERLHRRNEATLQTIPHSSLPEHVSCYHSLVPIDVDYTPKSQVYNVALAVYKAFSNADGNAYAMRRIHLETPISSEKELLVVHRWRKVRCANVVAVKDAFTSMAFGATSALVIVYDYYPCSVTLASMRAKGVSKYQQSYFLHESKAWIYLCQLMNAIRSIHKANLAARELLHISKIIVSSKNRLRILAGAIGEILDYNRKDLQPSLPEMQQKDFKQLLRTLVGVIGKEDEFAEIPDENFDQAITKLEKMYSPELVAALHALNATDPIDADHYIRDHLATRLMDMMSDLQDAHDCLEGTLMTELENARLVRLLTKIELVVDSTCAQNSPSQLITMFQAHVFQHYDEYGRKLVDLARILMELNKLDAGLPEKIFLVSPDEKQCVVASYREIKDVIETAYRRLLK